MYSNKRQIVEDAFAEFGMAAYVYDLDPGALERGARRMDSLAATWSAKGISFGYPLSSTSDLDQELNIPEIAETALVSNLAVLLAPGFGKEVSIETRQEAINSRNTLFAMFSTIPERVLSPLPAGAGNKPIPTGGSTFIAEERPDGPEILQ